MTEQDLKDLQELQAELLDAERSPWEPRCVARAFCSDEPLFSFTMRTWIDLDVAESPFLLGRMPEAEHAIEEFGIAFRAFGHTETTPEKCDPDELILLGRSMISAIAEAFAMRVHLAPPEGRRSRPVTDNGMGDWLSLLACLKSQLLFTLDDALALPVGRAFALIAAHRCNEGWRVAGTPYAMREES